MPNKEHVEVKISLELTTEEMNTLEIIVHDKLFYLEDPGYTKEQIKPQMIKIIGIIDHLKTLHCLETNWTLSSSIMNCTVPTWFGLLVVAARGGKIE